MQAIPTTYRGIRYRSRLEARWATLFTELDIQFMYEPKAFEMEDGNYVPDFYLPLTGTWIEVKPDYRFVNMDDWWTWFMCIEYGGVLDDVADSCGSTRGLMLLGSLPDRDINSVGSVPVHPILQHDEGVHVNLGQFFPGGVFVHNEHWEHYCSGAPELRKVCVEDQLPQFCKWPHGVYSEIQEAYRRAKYMRF